MEEDKNGLDAERLEIKRNNEGKEKREIKAGHIITKAGKDNLAHDERIHCVCSQSFLELIASLLLHSDST